MCIEWFLCLAGTNVLEVFIDEIHTIVGAGGSTGSLDAANIFKPALARGEIQCIGATTLDEFRENIKKDGKTLLKFEMDGVFIYRAITGSLTNAQVKVIEKDIEDNFKKVKKEKKVVTPNGEIKQSKKSEFDAFIELKKSEIEAKRLELNV